MFRSLKMYIAFGSSHRSQTFQSGLLIVDVEYTMNVKQIGVCAIEIGTKKKKERHRENGKFSSIKLRTRGRERGVKNLLQQKKPYAQN